MKKLKIILLSVFSLLLLGGGGYFYYYYKSTPLQYFPYPYVWNESKDITILEDRPHVLIIGDRMGKALSHFSENLSQNLSENLQSPIRIKNLAQYHEGLHRSLHQLQKLDKFPQVIIYHGGSEEYFEKKFEMKDMALIKKNIDLFQNSAWKTVLNSYPQISKFLYHKVSLVKANKIEKNPTLLPDAEVFPFYQILYGLFEMELEELHRLVKAKNSTLILVTTPLNLDVLPKKVCQQTSSQEIIKMQNAAYTSFQEGDYKGSLATLLGIKGHTPSNALTYYLLGQAYRRLGEKDKGLEHLQFSTALDCYLWRSNSVFNSLIRNFAKKNDIYLQDFDQLVNSQMGNDLLFLDDIFPQQLYYQQLIIGLENKIRKELHL